MFFDGVCQITQKRQKLFSQLEQFNYLDYSFKVNITFQSRFYSGLKKIFDGIFILIISDIGKVYTKTGESIIGQYAQSMKSEKSQMCQKLRRNVSKMGLKD